MAFPLRPRLIYVQTKHLAAFCLRAYLDTQAYQNVLVPSERNRNSCDETRYESDFNGFVELTPRRRRQRVGT